MITCETFDIGVEFRWPDGELNNIEWSNQYYKPALISLSEQVKHKARGRGVTYFLPTSEGAVKEIGDIVRFPGLVIPLFRGECINGTGDTIPIGSIRVRGTFLNEYDT